MPAAKKPPDSETTEPLLRNDGERQLAEELENSSVPKLERQNTRDEYNRAVLGLALYALSSCFLATALVFTKKLGALLVFIKKLAAWHMPVFEILIARSVTIMFFALCGCAWSRVNPLGNKRWLLTVRGIFGFGAIGNYFFAVSLLPLNDALVLSFSAPIWASVLGPYFLGEQSTNAVYGAIVMCMGGVLCITQPSFLGFAKSERSLLGVFFALFQAFCSACAKMLVRFLRSSESPHVSVFYQSAASLVVSLAATLIPKALGYEKALRMPHGWVEWSFMAGVGLTSYGSQICMTNALRFARAAPALAMSYLSVVLTLIYGYFFFAEVPTPLSLLGSALILSSTFMLGIFERKKDKQVEEISRRASLDSQRLSSRLLSDAEAPLLGDQPSGEGRQLPNGQSGSSSNQARS